MNDHTTLQARHERVMHQLSGLRDSFGRCAIIERMGIKHMDTDEAKKLEANARGYESCADLIAAIMYAIGLRFDEIERGS